MQSGRGGRKIGELQRKHVARRRHPLPRADRLRRHRDRHGDVDSDDGTTATLTNVVTANIKDAYGNVSACAACTVPDCPKDCISRLAWTNEEAGDAGQVTTVTFQEKAGKTLVTLHELYPSKEALDEARASGSQAGSMEETFDQLQELVAARSATSDVQLRCLEEKPT